jgi:dCMP deaminase
MYLQENHNAMQPGDHKAFMAMANDVARRSNCVRRAVGALIVRQGQVVAAGWNGVPESHRDCREAGCPRCINGGDTGSGYETCICIHAEQSAIADAARRGVSTRDSILYVNLRPCLQCLAIAMASGVREIFYTGEDWNYSDEIEKVYRTLCDQFDSFSRIAELQGSEVAGSLG